MMVFFMLYKDNQAFARIVDREPGKALGVAVAFGFQVNPGRTGHPAGREGGAADAARSGV